MYTTHVATIAEEQKLMMIKFNNVILKIWLCTGMYMFGNNRKKASAYQGLLIQQCRLQQKDFHLDQMVDQVVCNLYKRKMLS